MGEKHIFIGDSKIIHSQKKVKGQFVQIEGESFYKISHFDQMPDFFMTIVSNSDHWMFISSNGALSAGRKNRDNALFPYYTVDKIHDSKGKTGSKTICLVEKGDKFFLWEPFSEDSARFYRTTRNLYKSMYGNKLIFEEINEDLAIRFSYGWYSSERFGWIKKSEIQNLSDNPNRIQIVDGIHNIMPYGLEYFFQNEFSNLSDAYKKNELLVESGLGLFMLSSIPVDRAEPSEALKANTVWYSGLKEKTNYLISDQQLGEFRKGQKLETEFDIRAAKGAYYIQADLTMKSLELKSWYFAADINQDASLVQNLDLFLKDNADLVSLIRQDIQKGTRELVQIVASSDGLQYSEEEMNRGRHFSNVMFNTMRGGLFPDNYRLGKNDFLRYLDQVNKPKALQFHKDLSSLPEYFTYAELLGQGKMSSDPDLERICLEYLPLIFSRRHGDPSRPWNQFSIELKNDDGSPKLHYQGNWRDIFQNWEALSLSFPGFLQGMIAKFLDASTADGYNPYRITRDGIDWESPSPDDPWAYIGYWGDHQIIYLLKFLEWSEAYFPGQLEDLFNKEIFVHANVPYRIKDFEDLVEDPKNTIEFDHELNHKLQDLANDIGADGKLVRDKDGNVLRSGLIEKILVTLLTKLSNFIPEAGIWLNTQRPEWNDANNALVGNGASLVTLYYIRRFLVFWEDLLENTKGDDVKLSVEIYTFMKDIIAVFEENSVWLSEGFNDKRRFQMTRLLGQAGSMYRKNIYNRTFSSEKKDVPISEVQNLIKQCLPFIEQTIMKNSRNDGLYHAYNLILFKGEAISIRYLYEMLEGQVAVLSSGLLSIEESLKVMDSLKESDMFREDQYSYLLYPDRNLPRFEEKNNLPSDRIKESILLQKMMEAGDESIVSCDGSGIYHFNGDFRNASIFEEALEGLDVNKYGKLVEDEKEKLLAFYEEIFDHQSFTGRSGTFFGYEGLGSIYWHMVSKLLLAVQETFFRGVAENQDPKLLNRIREHYYEIKAGIGWYKSPDVYGAFPMDAYSHTPANAGVKQPGLTGQVKEDIITRLCELGIQVQDGKIGLNPSLFNTDELIRNPIEYDFVDVNREEQKISLESGQLLFSFCQVPFVYSESKDIKLIVEHNDGFIKEYEGAELPASLSRQIFMRTGKIVKIIFQYPFTSMTTA